MKAEHTRKQRWAHYKKFEKPWRMEETKALISYPSVLGNIKKKKNLLT